MLSFDQKHRLDIVFIINGEPNGGSIVDVVEVGIWGVRPLEGSVLLSHNFSHFVSRVPDFDAIDVALERSIKPYRFDDAVLVEEEPYALALQSEVRFLFFQ